MRFYLFIAVFLFASLVGAPRVFAAPAYFESSINSSGTTWDFTVQGCTSSSGKMIYNGSVINAQPNSDFCGTSNQNVSTLTGGNIVVAVYASTTDYALDSGLSVAHAIGIFCANGSDGSFNTGRNFCENYFPNDPTISRFISTTPTNGDTVATSTATGVNVIEADGGVAQILPCNEISQDCIRVKVLSATDISNIWVNQPTGGTSDAQYPSPYPSEWGVNSPQDVEITNPDGDYPSSGNELFIYQNGYAFRTGWSVDDDTDPPSFYLIDGCPSDDSSYHCVASGGVTLVANFYINPDDYVDGMYLSISATNQTLTLSGGSALDGFNAATGRGLDIQIPVVSGYNTISTSTDFQMLGKTTVKWSVNSPTSKSFSWTNNGFFNFALLGAKLLTQPNTLISTTTYFYYGTKTRLDTIVDESKGCLIDYFSTATTTGCDQHLLNSCNMFIDFNVIDCISFLFIPSTYDINMLISDFSEGFLRKVPWGYSLRFLELLNSSTTAPLPELSMTMPQSVGGQTIHLTSAELFNLFGDGSVIGNLQSSTSTGYKSFREISEPYWDALWAIILTFAVVSRFTGITSVIMNNKS